MLLLRQDEIREALLAASDYATLLGMLFLFLTLLAVIISIRKIRQSIQENKKAKEEWEAFENELKDN